MNHGLEAFGHDEVHTKEMFFRQTCIYGAQLRYSILFPVNQEVRLIIAALFWPYFLSVFNWNDQIWLSFEPTTCYTPLQTPQIHPSLWKREREGKRREDDWGHKTNLFLQVSDVYFPGSSAEDFYGRFPAIAEFGDVGGDVCFSGPFSSRTLSREYAVRFTRNMSLKACQGEAGASGDPWPSDMAIKSSIPSAFLKSLGNLVRWQLCPHLDLVHVSPRESQRFISFGVRCPLRKSVVSLERSGLTTDLASSGPPQLLMIWITHTNMRDFAGNVQNIKPAHAQRNRNQRQKSVALILWSLYACPLWRKSMYPPWWVPLKPG